MRRGKRKTQAPADTNAGRRRRWKRVLVVALLLSALAVWFAPAIAVRLFRAQILARISSHVDGQLAAQHISAGWFQPVVVQQLEARDANGQLLLAASEVRLERTLLSLFLNQNDLGLIRVTAPRLLCVVRKGGSNLEDFLKPLLSAEPSTSPLVVAWDVRDGQIELRTQNSNVISPSTWKLNSLQGKFERDEQRALSCSAELQSQGTANETGKVDVSLRATGLPLSGFDQRIADAKVTIHGQQLPLDTLQAVTERFGQSVALQGRLDGHFEAALEQGRWLCQWQSKVADGGPLQLTVAQNRPTLAITQWRSDGRLEWQDERWEMHTELTTDFGRALLDAESVAAGEVPPLLRWIAAGKVNLQAEVDLARLVSACPDLLRLRDDVVIRSGLVQLNVAGNPREAGTEWTAEIYTSNLAAQRGDQEIVWPEPVRAVLAARWHENQLVVDELVCRSEFLTVSLEGSADDATVRVDGDLTLLAERLQTLFDLPTQFRGRIDGELHWQRRPPEIIASGKLVAHDVEFSTSDFGRWQQPEMAAVMHATLRREAQPQRLLLTAGSAEFTSGTEHVHATLRSPVNLQTVPDEIAVDVNLRTDLQRDVWRRWLPLGNNTQLAGQFDGQGRFRWSSQQVEVESCEGEVRNLVLQAPYCQIREPRATFLLAGHWDTAARRWQSSHAEIATSTLAASGDDLRLALPDEGAAFDGNLLIRADVQRLPRWFSDYFTALRQWDLAGELVGKSQFSIRPQAMEFQWEADVQDLQVRARTDDVVQAAGTSARLVTLVNQPQTHLAGRLRWERNALLQLTGLELAGDSWRLRADAKFAQLNQQPEVEITGTADYDWQQLTPFLRSLAGPNVTLTGRRQDRFAISGLLPAAGVPASRLLRGTATIGWDAASYEGLHLGRTELPVVIDEGLVTFGPLSVPFSEGTLTTSPQLDLRQSPLQLTLPAGPVLQAVRISPEMCRGWLKYVAPPLADATQAEGKFSLELDHCAIPLSEPRQAQAQGILQIHGANIGASPVTQLVLTLVDRVAAMSERRLPRLSELATGAWVILPEQSVPFEVRDQHVRHHQLTMQAKEVTVLTRGAVSWDQQLDLEAQMQFPASLLQKNNWLNGLHGKWLPIHGTLKDPKLDEQAWQNLTRSFITGAAERLLEDELRKGLDRLLRPRE